MDDEQIIELFFERNEDALSAVSLKFGRYCGIIVKNVMGSASDAEECVNDTLLDVWNSIPPNKPENLRTYVGKIARNNALDRLKRDTAKKRGGKTISENITTYFDAITGDEFATEQIMLGG